MSETPARPALTGSRRPFSLLRLGTLSRSRSFSDGLYLISVEFSGAGHIGSIRVAFIGTLIRLIVYYAIAGIRRLMIEHFLEVSRRPYTAYHPSALCPSWQKAPVLEFYSALPAYISLWKAQFTSSREIRQ